MASKKIQLAGSLAFESISAGKSHFDRILQDTALGMHVTPEEFDQVNALYQDTAGGPAGHKRHRQPRSFPLKSEEKDTPPNASVCNLLMGQLVDFLSIRL